MPLIADGFSKVRGVGRMRDQVADAVCAAVLAVEAAPSGRIQMLALPGAPFMRAPQKR